MQTVVLNSPKGGVGKSTLSILLINALTSASKKVLAIDTDTVNHSLSFYYNDSFTMEDILRKNIFRVFSGDTILDNTLPINDNLDLIHSDIRLIDFRAVEYFRLKNILKSVSKDYDFCIIDTSPDYHNIIINCLYAANILIVPVIPDLFNYQSVKFLIGKLNDLEFTDLDVKLVFNQYEPPRSANKETYTNQMLSVFYNDKTIKPFITNHHISKSASLKKYINTDLKIKNNKSTSKLFQNITGFLSEALSQKLKTVRVI